MESNSRLFTGREWFVEGESAIYMLTDAPAICYVNTTNMELGTCKCMPYSFSSDSAASKDEFRYCFKKGKYIYCIPYLNKNIVRYDTEENLFENIDMEFWLRVLSYYISDNKLWLFSSAMRKIICVDLDDFTLEGSYSLVPEIESHEYPYGLGMAGTKKGLWCGTGERGTIAYFEYDTKEIRRYQINDLDDIVVAVYCKDKDLFVVGVEKYAVYHCEYNGSSVELKKIVLLSETDCENKGGIQPIADCFLRNDKLWVIAHGCNYLVAYDYKEKSVTYAMLESDEEANVSTNLQEETLSFCYLRENCYAGIRDIRQGKMYEVDLDTFKTKRVYFKYESDMVREIYAKKIVQEDMMGLGEYLSYIVL